MMCYEDAGVALRFGTGGIDVAESHIVRDGSNLLLAKRRDAEAPASGGGSR